MGMWKFEGPDEGTDYKNKGSFTKYNTCSRINISGARGIRSFAEEDAACEHSTWSHKSPKS